MTECAEIKKDGFVPGKTYKFNPPVLTNCIDAGGKKGWEQKSFPEGWCIEFKNGEGIFQGKPSSEKNEYYFKVIYGRGSVAVETNKTAK